MFCDDDVMTVKSCSVCINYICNSRQVEDLQIPFPCRNCCRLGQATPPECR